MSDKERKKVVKALDAVSKGFSKMTEAVGKLADVGVEDKSTKKLAKAVNRVLKASRKFGDTVYKLAALFPDEQL